jgi:hypothetical protein
MEVCLGWRVLGPHFSEQLYLLVPCDGMMEQDAGRSLAVGSNCAVVESVYKPPLCIEGSQESSLVKMCL